MSKARPLICLNMIVKNEMANIGRCLAAAADHISGWVICDTGSSDGTQDFIRSFFAARNIPGELDRVPFENFGQARNAALARAAASPLEYDYLLFADADMELVVEDRNALAGLEAAGYRLVQRTPAGFTYLNMRLARRGVAARYHGAIHEHLVVAGEVKDLKGVWFIDHASGSNRPGRLKHDIQLLLEALEEEPENPRSWFYLAQSYRDDGQFEQAVRHYRHRAALGGWPEEVWYSLYQIGRIQAAMGAWPEALASYLVAWQFHADRSEPLFQIAMYYQNRREYHISHLFLGEAMKVRLPETGRLFVEQALYTHLIKLEYAVACHWTGRHDEAIAVNDALLASPMLPENLIELVRKNRDFSARRRRS